MIRREKRKKQKAYTKCQEVMQIYITGEQENGGVGGFYEIKPHCLRASGRMFCKFIYKGHELKFKCWI